MSSSPGTWSVFAAVAVLLQLCFFLDTIAASSGRITLSNETDRMALLEFKSMISSDPLGVLSSWNSTTHFCLWHGVSCSKRHGRVQILNLGAQQLSGSISPHIGNLSFLRGLFLFTNSFTGRIPPDIGRLRRLQQLALLNNSLDGEIPSNISGCSALTRLEVGNNKLAGQLPWQIGSLNRLQIFYGGKNNLTGGIPSSFGNLSSLHTFVVNANLLSGEIPDALGQWKNLRVLVLQMNNFSSEIPASIFNLSSLTKLHFGWNQLHGNIPSDIGISLPNLQQLEFCFNQLTGSVPASLSNASNLVLLQLQVNNFTGSMPGMGSSHNLENFWIYGNSLGSGKAGDLSFLSSLANASRLQRLVINRNNFGGSIPEQIGNLSTKLEALSLSFNRLSGSIPMGIQNLINLVWLDASYNELSGTIPSTIGHMHSLQLLGLSGNNISGAIPLSMGNLTKLLRLVVDNNQLQGDALAAILSCSNLIALDLAFNNFSGLISSKFTALSSLSIYMNLSHNQLTGAIPVEIGSLVNLGSLDLSHNKLSGNIPSSFSNCIKLELLSLQDNLLQGTIPSSLSSLRGIEQIDISMNNLSGPIPKMIGDMKQLQLLNLSYNNFEGEAPLNGVFKNDSIVSIVGNSRLCGGAVELNLQPCKSKHQKETLSHKLRIVISTISSVLLLTFVSSCILIFWVKKRGKQETISGDDSKLHLSYRDLFKATDGFSTTNLLGMGSFGSVYKGVLGTNEIATTIAVKVFNLQRRGSSKSFMAECAALKNIRHRNLVRVLTVCSGVDYQGNDFKALIYEFLANGSLEDWLHPTESRGEPLRSLNFLQRLNVVVDVASALDYLHHQCGKPIAHCDLKPSNVLLDEDMTGHVSDFGLARFLGSMANSSSAGQSSSSIGIKGTVGYAPPEYGMGNVVSIKGDASSYGVLLLEIFTGKRPTDEIFKEGMNIHRFVRVALSEKLIPKVLDPILLKELPLSQTTHFDTICSSSNTESTTNINGQILEEVLISILEIGVACSSNSPNERICISEVVARLISFRKLLRDKFRDNGGK